MWLGFGGKARHGSTSKNEEAEKLLRELVAEHSELFEIVDLLDLLPCDEELQLQRIKRDGIVLLQTIVSIVVVICVYVE